MLRKHTDAQTQIKNNDATKNTQPQQKHKKQSLLPLRSPLSLSLALSVRRHQSSFNTQTNTHEHADTTRTQNNGMITNVWAVLCDQEVPVMARSEARCDQEPPSPPRPPPRPHDELWEQRLRTKGPASHQGQDAQNSKVYCFCARQW